ncbi:hypothetical protein [Nocardiopsis sp. FR26]|uniref:hypothetical protein n=1 Tax=Nocardiopsis sp. FR26 TaxID=2605987 RepID=UPI0013588CED|nr:hypothetical protein [Nocardiopsis sp. FR26]
MNLAGRTRADIDALLTERDTDIATLTQAADIADTRRLFDLADHCRKWAANPPNPAGGTPIGYLLALTYADLLVHGHTPQEHTP